MKLTLKILGVLGVAVLVTASGMLMLLTTKKKRRTSGFDRFVKAYNKGVAEHNKYPFGRMGWY